MSSGCFSENMLYLSYLIVYVHELNGCFILKIYLLRLTFVATAKLSRVQ